MILLLACAEPPDTTSVRYALATSVPLAWVATQAMAAFEGAPGECVAWATACTTTPCVGALQLTPGAACPMALGDTTEGVVDVTVAVGAAGDDIVFAAAFGGLRVDGGPPWLVDAGGATASRTSDQAGLVVAFTGLDVSLNEEAPFVVRENGWAVTIEEAATMGDTRDDTLVLQGASQWVAASGKDTGVYQTVLSDIAFTPACRANPTAGVAGIQSVGADGDAGVPRLDLVSVTFDEACDGTGDLVSAGTSGAFDEPWPVTL